MIPKYLSIYLSGRPVVVRGPHRAHGDHAHDPHHLRVDQARAALVVDEAVGPHDAHLVRVGVRVRVRGGGWG